MHVHIHVYLAYISCIKQAVSNVHTACTMYVYVHVHTCTCSYMHNGLVHIYIQHTDIPAYGRRYIQVLHVSEGSPIVEPEGGVLDKGHPHSIPYHHKVTDL